MIHITLPRIPTEDMILWGMKPRERRDGIIVALDDENYVVQQIVTMNGIDHNNFWPK